MPVEMPSRRFRSGEFGLRTNTARFTSPLNNATQRMILDGAMWVATYTLPRMKRAQAEPWMAFLLSLKGSAHTFYAYDPDYHGPTGFSPLVKGDGQAGNTLVTDGWPASSPVLRAGALFSVGIHLHQLTADANTDGGGEATLQFEPPLRTSPSDNAPLTLDRPACAMILQDDGQAMWRADECGVYDEKTFTAIEPLS